jgi:hypothetical protein
LRAGRGWKFIVSNDRDLLGLEKPFAAQIFMPAQLLLRIRGEAVPGREHGFNELASEMI